MSQPEFVSNEDESLLSSELLLIVHGMASDDVKGPQKIVPKDTLRVPPSCRRLLVIQTANETRDRREYLRSHLLWRHDCRSLVVHWSIVSLRMIRELRYMFHTRIFQDSGFLCSSGSELSSTVCRLALRREVNRRSSASKRQAAWDAFRRDE